MRERRLLYLPRLSVHPYSDGDGLAIATEYRGGLADADFHPRSPTGARGGPSGCRYRRRSRPRRGVRPRSLRDDRRLSRDSFRFRRALSLPCVRTHERRQYGVSEVMPLCVRVSPSSRVSPVRRSSVGRFPATDADGPLGTGATRGVCSEITIRAGFSRPGWRGRWHCPRGRERDGPRRRCSRIGRRA